jgi:hypothetical protein
MKFEKPFHIKVQPYYNIKEPTTERENAETILNVRKLGGITSMGERPEGEEVEMVRSGGKMDWNLFNESNGSKPEVNIHLMRLWTLQMVTQMVNEKAYTNEVHSEPKFEITEENKKIVLETIHEMTNILNDELEKTNNSLITKKKNKFNFNENVE